MSVYRHLCTTALVASLAAACAPQKGSDTSDEKIYGGTAVTDSTWQGAVAIVIAKDATTQSLCSGTLVTPQLVITAAHCFVDDASAANVAAAPTPDKFTIYFGNSVTGGQKVTATKGNWNPQYKNDPINDVAYLVLSAPVSNVEIVQPATDPTETAALTQVGASATVVGFGTTEAQAVGQKYQMTSAVGNPDNGALFIGGNGKDSCQGDSGGPAYGQVNGQWRVFGVTSRGVGCGNGGDYARMFDSLCWVEQDSGQKIPGSKLACDAATASTTAPTATGAATGTATTATGTTPPATGGTAAPAVGNDLDAFLAPNSLDPSSDVFEFDIGAPQAVVTVKMCFGDLNTCETSQNVGLDSTKVTGPAPDRSYFKTTHPVKLTKQATITLLGYDANNSLIQARAFSFVKKDGT